MTVNTAKVVEYLKNLQTDLISSFEQEDQKRLFLKDPWQYPTGGGGLTCVITDGEVFEKGGVNFSHIKAPTLPDAILKTKPHLQGYSFEVCGVSVVIHPSNPYVPTSHMNVRFFLAEKEGCKPVWWFGGGYDLTPYYGFSEDCAFWHHTAKAACDPFKGNLYQDFKKQCDEYFYLPHRDEARGIGGLFFDYINDAHEAFDNFDQCFLFLCSIGDSYKKAYLPIVQKRKKMNFSQREKDFQLFRRGRYVEFNLLYDRGTHFGLQSSGRVESILMSLPPHVDWHYNYQAEENSQEAKFVQEYLQVKDWV